MTSSDTTAATPAASAGVVLFAYDGSDLAKLAIEQAGRQLAPGRDALVVCVWQPGDVGFVASDERPFNAAEATEVQKAAQETAARGASLAEQAGFRAQSLEFRAAPTWQGIVEVADKHEAGIIVLGTHRRSGIAGHLLGSVTAAVMAHAAAPLLVVYL
jgi:nucleotide-binding universal stress UspA family protein